MSHLFPTRSTVYSIYLFALLVHHPLTILLLACFPRNQFVDATNQLPNGLLQKSVSHGITFFIIICLPQVNNQHQQVIQSMCWCPLPNCNHQTTTNPTPEFFISRETVTAMKKRLRFHKCPCDCGPFKFDLTKEWSIVEFHGTRFFHIKFVFGFLS